MNQRGGFCPLPISRACREGILRRPSAVARMESLRAPMSMIAPKMLCIRAVALSEKSWVLRCARITIQSPQIKGIPSLVGMFLLVNLNNMGKHFSSHQRGSPLIYGD